MNLRQRHRPSTDFSLASMSDIVFLLLIFFMITSSFAQQGVKVELPQSSSEQPSQGQFTITITKEKDYYWNEERIDRTDVGSRIQSAVSDKKKAFTLKTDREVTMDDAAYVMSEIARHGGTVVIATRKM